MPYTKDDVGDVPGRSPLSDVEKQAIADEWNAEEARRAAELAVDPEPTLAEKVEALMAAAPANVRADATARARARRGG